MAKNDRRSTQRKGAGRPAPPMSRGARVWEGVKVFFGLVTLVVLVGGIATALYAVRLVKETAEDLPRPDKLIDYTPGGVTTVYATDKDPKTGKNLILGQVYAEYKEFVPITKVPAVVKKATVAIEDERFYQHPGVDFEAIARALVANLKSGEFSQGGSTLTQQLARDILRDRKKTVSRKIQEALLAILLEKHYSKEQILEMYLNEVCYGVNTYGIQAASKLYFGRNVKNLSLSQAAILAAIPQRPSAFELFDHKDAAIRRRNIVLAKMRELGYIDAKQEKVAASNGVRLVTDRPKTHQDFKAPYFTNYVIRQLVRKYGEDAVYRGGLQVYTTLNYKMQQEADRALINGVMRGRSNGVTQGALISIEPRSGYIRAMAGGVDFHKDQFNHTVQGGRQPGSSFKVFVYTAAMMANPRRYNPYSSVDNSRKAYGKYRPGGSGPYGSVSMSNALTYSYNNASVNTAYTVGVRRVIETARRMGVTSRLEPNLSLALGSYEVTPLEMAGAYAVFANHGDRAEPMSIIRVIDAEGVMLENNLPRVEKTVVPESVVASMSSMLANVVAFGTASRAQGIDEVSNAHGKTGTTNDNKDAWFVGYTPELSTAVWVCGVRRVKQGNREVVRYPPMAGVTGGQVCAPIWARFMKAAIPIQRAAKLVPLPPPESVVPPINKPGTPSPADGEGDGTTRDPVMAELPDEDARPRATAAVATTVSPVEATVSARPPDAAQQPVSADASHLPIVNSAHVLEPTAAPPRTFVASEDPIAPTRVSEQPRRSSVPVAAAPPRPPVQRTVTVSVCPDSGGRASRWCPETVSRTFPAGGAPRGNCRQHRPMPGDG